MIIAVGTTNPAKLQAVRELRAYWPALGLSETRHEGVGVGVQSIVRAQPLNLHETIGGAEHRARTAWEAFGNVALAIGIESGLMVVHEGRILDVCACVLYDGARKRSSIGLSGAWEIPLAATTLCYEKGLDLTQAFLKIGLIDDPKINEHGGAIACVTDGRITRTEYTKQAIEMALAGWEK